MNSGDFSLTHPGIVDVCKLMNVVSPHRFASYLGYMTRAFTLGLSLIVISPGQSYAGVSVQVSDSDISPSCVLSSSPSCSMDQDHRAQPSKVLLLLHEPGARYLVWNEWVRQKFNDRCPVIHSGVIVGEDSHNLSNGVYCYRIAFLSTLKVSPGGAHPKRLGSEIQAAQSAIMQRHPNSHFVFMAQGEMGRIAETWLSQYGFAVNQMRGLLVIGINLPRHEVSTNTKILSSPRFDVLMDEATPSQASLYGISSNHPEPVKVSYSQLNFKMQNKDGQPLKVLEREADISRVMTLWLGDWWGHP